MARLSWKSILDPQIRRHGARFCLLYIEGALHLTGQAMIVSSSAGISRARGLKDLARVARLDLIIHLHVEIVSLLVDGL